MATYPRDQFDQQPDDLLRVGAHRAPRKKGRGWVGFFWATLATAVLVVGGLYGLSRVNAGIDFELPIFGGGGSTPTPTATPTPTLEPVLDPTTIDPNRAITITVLNGTATAGLQNTVGDTLVASSWPIGARAVASANDIQKTFVYYADPANEDVARGLVVAMGVGEIRLSDAFPGAPITVVLGADYPVDAPAG
jgi:hypothetical protein